MAFGLRPLAEQCVGDLDQDAGTVAEQRIGPDRAAMVEVVKDFQGLGDDRMAFLPADMSNEAHSARVMLMLTVVQALGLGKPHSIYRPQAR